MWLSVKIFITGGKGQLGSELGLALKKKECFVGALSKRYEDCEWLSFSSSDLDITDFEKTKEILEVNRPDVVINCAAFTDVDACEADPRSAMAVNAAGAKNLAIICQGISSKLVHISTDYVFDGSSEKAYCEWDVCNPGTVYGKSKLLGERYVQEFSKKHFIIRTSWLYGLAGKNFVKTILELSKIKKDIKVVNDQVGNPTNANDLAYHILDLALTENYGLYNCSGKGVCSWFDFASKIVEYAGRSCRVIPVSTLEYQKVNFRAAKRPRNSALENLMLEIYHKNKMREWTIALEGFIKDSGKS